MSIYLSIRKPAPSAIGGFWQNYPYVEIGPDLYEGLRPCFEAIKVKTGKLIDLYDWVEFRGVELDYVIDELSKKKAEIDKKLETIVAKLEVPGDSVNDRTDFTYGLSLLSAANEVQRSLDLVNIAKIDGKVLVCKGD